VIPHQASRMEQTTGPARSLLPRPKSTTLRQTSSTSNLARSTTQSLIQPSISRSQHRNVNTNDQQLHIKPSSSRLRPLSSMTCPSTSVPPPQSQARPGIARPDTLLTPKKPIENIKRLISSRSMLQLPRSRAIPSLTGTGIPLEAKRTVSSTSSRRISSSSNVKGQMGKLPEMVKCKQVHEVTVLNDGRTRGYSADHRVSGI
jgi:hypothetical protein